MLARPRAFGGQGWPPQLDRRGIEDPTAISRALNFAHVTSSAMSDSMVFLEACGRSLGPRPVSIPVRA